MTGCIEERYLAVVLHSDLIRADMLRNAARFLFGYARLPNCIQERRLSVIDVTHDRHDGRAWRGIFRDADFNRIEHDAFFECDKVRVCVELLRDVLRHLFVERLVDSREYTSVHQLLDHVLRFDVELFRQILYGQAFSQRHLAIFARRFRLRLRPDKR